MDYGHDLLFGAFIMPDVQRPQHPVDMAEVADRVGLDLAGGRFELGIGAGRLWDEIAAMGGPHRKPGQAVDALEDAITIVREVWATDKPGAVIVDGKQYRVGGGSWAGSGA